MAKTTNKKVTKNSKTVKNLVKIMQNSPKTKNAKATTSTFTRRTVAPNIEQIGPKAYRPRLTVDGVRKSTIVTSMTAATKWLKQMKTTANVR